MAQLPAAPSTGGTDTATPSNTITTDQLLQDQQGQSNLSFFTFGLLGGPTAPSATVQVPTPPTDRSQWTSVEWAVLLLTAIGAPVTVNNVINIETWMASEEPKSDWLANNDPLNTTEHSSGFLANDSGGYGGPGYDDVQDGIAATADTIQQPQYSLILAALQQDAPADTFKAAVVASPWSSDHYSNGTHFASAPLTAFATATGGNPTGEIGQIASGATGVLGQAGTILGDLSSSTWWKRLGVGALGVALIIGGLILFVSQTGTAKKIESDVTTAAVV